MEPPREREEESYQRSTFDEYGTANPRLIAELKQLDNLGLEEGLWLKRMGVDPKRYHEERKRRAVKTLDRYQFFKPLESVRGDMDEEQVEVIQELGEPSETEREWLRKWKKGEIKKFNPSHAYTMLEHKIAGDLQKLRLPVYIPHAIPRDQWENLSYIRDDLMDDLIACEKEDSATKKAKGEDDVEEIEVSAEGKVLGTRGEVDQTTGRETTTFMQLCFMRVGVAFGTGFLYGGLTGFTIAYQTTSEMKPSLRRTVMMNSTLHYATKISNSFGVLAFMYTSIYVVLRDHVASAGYYKTHEIDKERFMVCSTSGFLTGALYKLSLRHRLGMLISGSIGALACGAATFPYEVPGITSAFKMFKRMTRKRDDDEQLFTPVGMEGFHPGNADN
ncbi:hypothetical protein AAMO2058_001119100 [Amorphochlora amoebiformis]